MSGSQSGTRPLDILHVIDSIGHGGAEQNLLALVRRLDPLKYRHHLAWLYPDDRLLEQFRPHVATLLPLKLTGTRDLPRGTLQLAQWIRKNRPAVIHAQLVRAQLMARLARAMVLGPPIVTTWVSPIYDQNSVKDFAGSATRQRVNRVLDMVTGVADAHFIGVSKETADHCARALHVSARRVSVINTMLDSARFAEVPGEVLQEMRRKLEVPSDAVLLFSAARLTEQKGHTDAIAAMPGILAKHPTAVFLIAGLGPLETRLRAQVAQAGLDAHVRFLGYRADFPALCQLADLFLFASHYEGLPVALIEALANGLPAVLSDIPPHREVAGRLQTVRFVRPGNPVGLAAAVIAMLDERVAVTARLAESTQKIREAFSADLLAARFAEVFERAAMGDGGRREGS